MAPCEAFSGCQFPFATSFGSVMPTDDFDIDSLAAYLHLAPDELALVVGRTTET